MVGCALAVMATTVVVAAVIIFAVVAVVDVGADSG